MGEGAAPVADGTGFWDGAHAKLDVLKGILRATGGLAVAFSGGVDSTFLLAVAQGELGDRVLAVTAASRAFPMRELAEARAFCGERGIRQIVVDAHEVDAPGYRDNPPDRCYLCKTVLFGALWDCAREQGFEVLADGSNVDDEGDYRPGMRALAELGVRSPLREAGLTKAEIRLLSHEMGLPTWDKPSFACLSSRFPYGERITDEGLARVDAAEQYLLGRGLHQVRVRVHGGTVARIETLPGEFDMVAAEPARSEIRDRLRGLGFSYVALDLGGYRSGSLNEVLGG